MPVLFVIQECDHMRQKNIVGLLPTKEHTQLCNAIFKECLFYNVLGVTKQSHDFSLNKFMESLEFSVITSLEKGNIEWINDEVTQK